VVCSAPGKLILTGEHSVVYGEPALIGAISLRTRVLARRHRDATISVSSLQLGGCREETADSLHQFLEKAELALRDFEERGELRQLERLRRDPYVVAKIALGEVFDVLGKASGGLRIRIDSKLPVGSGLGSSASVASAVIGTIGRLYDRRWNLDRVNALVYQTEKIMHGRPSGGDNTAVVYGGILRFRKIGRRFSFRRIGLAKGLLPKIILVDSGRPTETTGEMVEGVKVKSQKSKVKSIIRKMGKISRAFIHDYRNGEFSVNLIQDNERLLEELGVVGTRARAMVRAIERLGGVAKISGAGGIREGSGILIAYHHNVIKLRNFLVKKGWKPFPVRLGVEGIRCQA